MAQFRVGQRQLVIALSLGVIGAATLFPGGGQTGFSAALPDAADLLLNLALFVPLGAGLAGLRVRGAALAAAVVSCTIELLQLSLVPGRDSSPWDVLANTTGAALGAGLPAVLLALPLPLGWLVSGWLLAPVPPPTSVWWGQWAHQFGSSAPFTGTVRAVTLNQVTIPEGPLGASRTAQLRTSYDPPPLELAVTLAPPRLPSPDRNQVAGIASGDGGEVIGLWQLGWDLQLTWHARGTRWGLRQPSLRLVDLLHALPDTLHTISATVENGHAFLEITSDRRRGIRLGPWEGWRLLWPLEVPRPRVALLVSVLWTAGCLGLPITALVRSRRRVR